ncbi:DUF5606 domain-containing protein [Salibacteraceae bacterium]|jgi:hypothetical protein|nr:DUF5606 domain-containing protein [Salibacteraceae bacterium]MDB4105210.1 DUF5606 domain-containing protein [Salibacteraceae bacterium]MDB9708986.1 DUF5606 domain-containing protein [Salibacteraceae bacterium]
MALEQILSVSGKSGLYKLVGQMKNGIIVESIGDGKRFPVHGSAKVSALEEISIYTETEEVPLKDIFKKVYEKEKGKQAISHKEDSKKVKAYFESILPDYDKDRVYESDMAKAIRWYNLLIEFDAYDPNEVEESEDVEEVKTEDADSKSDGAKAKPKKAPSKKKSDTPKAKAAPKRSASTKVSTPRKSGGTQRGS